MGGGCSTGGMVRDGKRLPGVLFGGGPVGEHDVAVRSDAREGEGGVFGESNSPTGRCQAACQRGIAWPVGLPQAGGPVGKWGMGCGIGRGVRWEIGSWVIDEEPLGEGQGWQEWPAFHRVLTTSRARIRFLVTPPGSTAQVQARARRIVEHEYRTMSRLAHEGLLAPRDLVDGEFGVGLVYERDERFQRLDLWLAEHPDGLPIGDLLSVLRQVAEAVAYAHRNRVVHRGLTPHAVLVRELAGGGVRAVVGDWQTAGAVRGPGESYVSSGVTGLLGALEAEQGSAAQRLERMLVGGDADRRLVDGFQAPEGAYGREADRIRLDVFALGALAYFLLSGRAAAADRAALRERLHRDRGLDLAADLPQVPSAIRTLLLEATRPAVSQRLADVGAFLELLTKTVGAAVVRVVSLHETWLRRPPLRFLLDFVRQPQSSRFLCLAY